MVGVFVAFIRVVYRRMIYMSLPLTVRLVSPTFDLKKKKSTIKKKKISRSLERTVIKVNYRYIVD